MSRGPFQSVSPPAKIELSAHHGGFALCRGFFFGVHASAKISTTAGDHFNFRMQSKQSRREAGFPRRKLTLRTALPHPLASARHKLKSLRCYAGLANWPPTLDSAL